jgi:hypothetical protein
MRKGRTRFDWVHPSYRDLVIEELAADRSMRQEYIARGGIHAIQLAVSEEGGAKGERKMPLMIEKSDWESIESACILLIKAGGSSTHTSLLELFASLVDSYEQIPSPLSSLISKVATEICAEWNSSDIFIHHLDLERYFKLGARTVQELPYPHLDFTWSQVSEELMSQLENSRSGSDISAEDLDVWVDTLTVIQTHSPQTLIRAKFGKIQDGIIKQIIESVRELLSWEPSLEGLDDARYEADRLSTMAGALRKLAAVSHFRANVLAELATKAEARGEQYSGRIVDEDEQYYENEGYADREAPFDVEGLFIDL